MNDFWKAFDDVVAWSSDLSGNYQKLAWSAAVLVGGYVLGLAVSALLKLAARRMAGIRRRKKSEGDAEGDGADHAILGALGALIRVCFVLAACAVVADIYGVYDIAQAQGLAINAAKAVGIFFGIWVLGSWFARRVRGFGTRGIHRDVAASKTLFSFMATVVQSAAIAIGVIAALQQFDFPIASLVAVIGAAGLAIALSLQDTLKAVAAGVILAIFRPFRIGDVVRAGGETGTVVEINPFTTTLNTVDNKRLIITNDKVWGATIENFTINGLRRIDEIIGISYDDDIDKAMAVVEQVVIADRRAHKSPPFWIKVNTLNTSSVDLRFRIWCSASDYFDLRCDLLKVIKEAFDKGGITIPYPHQVEVHKEALDAKLANALAAITNTEGKGG